MSQKSKSGIPQDANNAPKGKRKVSQSETGHAINVANFEDLESFCIGYGPKYNPSNPAIKLPAIATLKTAAVNILISYDELYPLLIRAVDDREIAFAPLNSIVRRLNNGVASSDVTTQFIKDVRSITRKLLGEKVTKKHPTLEDNPNIPESELIKNHSASQLSMDNRVENLFKLIQLLKSEPKYNPNEDDLKVAGLTTLYDAMKATNTAVISANTPVSNLRIERDEILYHPKTGLVNTASKIKKYIKSAFGVSSQQYKQVSKLKFKAGSDLANKVK